MKILFISNYYPPSNYGWGYMQLCEEVADGLSSRGHEIAVLTSTRCDGLEFTRSYPVYRLLPVDPDWHSGKTAARQFFIGRQRREKDSITQLLQLVESFQPEIVFIWHAIGLSRAMLQTAENLPGITTIYYLAGYLPELPDEYIAYWQKNPVRLSAKILKSVVGRFALAQLEREGKPLYLRYDNVICVSDYVRKRLIDQNLISEKAIVINNGIDFAKFKAHDVGRTFEGRVSLLYAGRLEHEKGVHTILEALAILPGDVVACISDVYIVGDGDDSYKEYLHKLVNSLPGQDRVRLCEPVERDRVPRLLEKFDIFIMPSQLEALSRMVQEAMATGLLVIGTDSGGSSELLVHGQTGLVFEAGNSKCLALQLKKVIRKPSLAKLLASSGQNRVFKSFRIDQTISGIENHLQTLIQ